MFFPPSWVFLLSLLTCALANTEIANFGINDDLELGNISVATHYLDAEVNERVLSVVPMDNAAHADILTANVPKEAEMWIELRADSPAWSSYERFTARISSPASAPVDVYISIFDASSEEPPRTKLARVRARHFGVVAADAVGATKDPARFVITMEPLLFGVLPQSVLGFLGLAAVTLVVATRFFLPRAIRELDSLAYNIRTDGVSGKAKKAK